MKAKDSVYCDDCSLYDFNNFEGFVRKSTVLMLLVWPLCDIFIVTLHFRQLEKSRQITSIEICMVNQIFSLPNTCLVLLQRLSVPYNIKSAPPSHEASWIRSDHLLYSLEDSVDGQLIFEFITPMWLSRAKVASLERHSTSTMFQTRNGVRSSSSEYHGLPHQLSTDECNEDFRYNISVEQRFHLNRKIMNHESWWKRTILVELGFDVRMFIFIHEYRCRKDFDIFSSSEILLQWILWERSVFLVSWYSFTGCKACCQDEGKSCLDILTIRRHCKWYHFS